jgi:hypothetical protein
VAKKGTNPDGAAWAAALKHRPHFQKSLGEYFATYQVKERGLKKWIEEARADWITAGCPTGGPDFPPLDDPPKMLAWWLAHKTHQPSAALLALAGKSAADLAPPPAADGAAATGKPPAGAAAPRSQRAAINLSTLAPTDLPGAVLHQRQVLAAAMQEYTAAMADPEIPEATISLRAKRADDAMERLRTMESSLAKFQRDNGELVHRDTIRDDCAPLFTAMADSLVSELVETFGLPRAQAMHFTDRWFGLLRASRFFTTVVPSHAPTTAAA